MCTSKWNLSIVVYPGLYSWAYTVHSFFNDIEDKIQHANVITYAKILLSTIRMLL